MTNWTAWTQSPPGHYLLAWEQARLDDAVSDIFGYHALQLGLPQIDALRENRMPYRGLVLDAAHHPNHLNPRAQGLTKEPLSVQRNTVWCDFPELPFAARSVDLLILPHTLEFTHDPHYLLREADRVLVPEGQLIILGFNALSLWRLRQSLGKKIGHPFVPAVHDFISLARLKDWIKLLGFEMRSGTFGCYKPPLNSAKWLGRYAFMEAAGHRWWPIFGASYLITAIKHAHSMRLVGLKVRRRLALAPILTPQS